MKITITEQMKNVLTIAEHPAARQMIKEYRGQDLSFEIELAAEIGAGLGWAPEILRAEAEIIRNARTEYDQFGEGTGHLDIELHILAYDRYNAFFDISACLSDIWQASSDNREEIRARMYVLKYTR